MHRRHHRRAFNAGKTNTNNNQRAKQCLYKQMRAMHSTIRNTFLLISHTESNSKNNNGND